MPRHTTAKPGADIGGLQLARRNRDRADRLGLGLGGASAGRWNELQQRGTTRHRDANRESGSDLAWKASAITRSAGLRRWKRKLLPGHQVLTSVNGTGRIGDADRSDRWPSRRCLLLYHLLGAQHWAPSTP